MALDGYLSCSWQTLHPQLGEQPRQAVGPARWNDPRLVRPEGRSSNDPVPASNRAGSPATAPRHPRCRGLGDPATPAAATATAPWAWTMSAGGLVVRTLARRPVP